jgi:hypothetical protein
MTYSNVHHENARMIASLAQASGERCLIISQELSPFPRIIYPLHREEPHSPGGLQRDYLGIKQKQLILILYIPYLSSVRNRRF